jgi:hypothetical protein
MGEEVRWGANHKQLTLLSTTQPSGGAGTSPSSCWPCLQLLPVSFLNEEKESSSALTALAEH